MGEFPRGPQEQRVTSSQGSPSQWLFLEHPLLPLLPPWAPLRLGTASCFHGNQERRGLLNQCRDPASAPASARASLHMHTHTHVHMQACSCLYLHTLAPREHACTPSQRGDTHPLKALAYSPRAGLQCHPAWHDISPDHPAPCWSGGGLGDTRDFPFAIIPTAAFAAPHRMPASAFSPSHMASVVRTLPAEGR